MADYDEVQYTRGPSALKVGFGMSPISFCAVSSQIKRKEKIEQRKI
jgi:hypothetical protein